MTRFEMRLAIKASSDLSAFGIAFSQKRQDRKMSERKIKIFHLLFLFFFPAIFCLEIPLGMALIGATICCALATLLFRYFETFHS
jgi:amino acid permease